MSKCEFALPTVDSTDTLKQSSRDNCESFPLLLHRSGELVNIPIGLVVSSNYEICGLLADELLLNGIAPVIATGIQESRDRVTANHITIVICEEVLPDGKYSEILRLTQRTINSPPVIVVSKASGWEEYFTAVEMGAYDFFAFPPIPGEFQRVIRNCFMKRISATQSQDTLS